MAISLVGVAQTFSPGQVPSIQVALAPSVPGTNRLVVAHIAIRIAAASAVSYVTFGGIQFTFVNAINTQNGAVREEIWYLAGSVAGGIPDSGTVYVELVGGPAKIGLIASYWNGVQQVLPLRAQINNANATAAPGNSLGAPIVATDLVIDTLSVRQPSGGTTATKAAPQTLLGTTQASGVGSSNFLQGASYRIVVGAAIDRAWMQWTLGTVEFWAQGSAAFIAAAGSVAVSSGPTSINFELLDSVANPASVNFELMKAMQVSRVINYELLDSTSVSSLINFELNDVVSSSAVVNFELLTKLTKASLINYELMKSLSKQSVINYELLKGAIQKQAAINYELLKRVTPQALINFELIGGLAVVQKIVGINFELLAQLSKPSLVNFELLKGLTKQSLINYELNKALNNSAVINFELLKGAISKSSVINYELHGGVYVPRAVNFELMDLLSVSRSINFEIVKVISFTAGINFEIIAAAGTDVWRDAGLLVRQIDPADYPGCGFIFVAEIRTDSVANPARARLTYSPDDGVNWNPVANSVVSTLSTGYLVDVGPMQIRKGAVVFSVPLTLPGVGLYRVEFGGPSASMSSQYSIYGADILVTG